MGRGEGEMVLRRGRGEGGGRDIRALYLSWIRVYGENKWRFLFIPSLTSDNIMCIINIYTYMYADRAEKNIYFVQSHRWNFVLYTRIETVGTHTSF